MGVGEELNEIVAVTTLPGHQFQEDTVRLLVGFGSVAGSPTIVKSIICCPPGVHEGVVGVGVGVGLGVGVAVGT